MCVCVCVCIYIYIYIIGVLGIAGAFDAHACVCEMLPAAELDTGTLQRVVFFGSDVRSADDLPLCKGSSWDCLNPQLCGSH